MGLIEQDNAVMQSRFDKHVLSGSHNSSHTHNEQAFRILSAHGGGGPLPIFHCSTWLLGVSLCVYLPIHMLLFLSLFLLFFIYSTIFRFIFRDLQATAIAPVVSSLSSRIIMCKGCIVGWILGFIICW